MKKIALILACFLAACNPDREIATFESPDSECVPDSDPIDNVCHGALTFNSKEYTNEENLALYLGAMQLNTFFGKVLVSLTDTQDQQESCHISVANLESSYLGIYYESNNNIELDIEQHGTDLALLTNTVSHELLHSLGFVHSVGGLMCSIVPGHYLNDVDLAQCQSLGLWDATP